MMKIDGSERMENHIPFSIFRFGFSPFSPFSRVCRLVVCALVCVRFWKLETNEVDHVDPSDFWSPYLLPLHHPSAGLVIPAEIRFSENHGNILVL